MLILTRRTGEQIDLTDEDGRLVTIVVLGVIGNQVRYGISARKTMTIDRHEITLRKKREASGLDPDGNVAVEPNDDYQPARPDVEPEPLEERRPLIRMKRKRCVDSLDTRREREGVY
jgi:carbon storage regulator CsrA